jgi:TPR repeat protein
VWSDAGAGEDARALCLAWRASGAETVHLLGRAAEMGYPPAQGMMCSHRSGDERLAWAKPAAAQGDRRGTYMLGVCISKGLCCAKDTSKGNELIKKAAELAYFDAQEWLWEYLFTYRD